ncbi:MAG: RNA polymerase factor sigma-54 [Nitrosomonas sp.]|nr:RNA polymerase factor sigma-54 [Nitrosomonas sp.]MDP1950109.1 RNA polymerase factor sigma-54 [Nitrosomonas sp.]
MKPTLQLKLSQQLKLTPQLQQSIRLLQLSTIELNQEIERIVQENPLLELEEAAEYRDVPSEKQAAPSLTHSPDFPDETATSIPPVETNLTQETSQSNESDPFQEYGFSRAVVDHDDENGFSQLVAKPLDLRGHLSLQLSLGQISERDRRIGGLLIDSLDDDGYLLQDLNELIDLLPPELKIGADDLQAALVYLQQLDPPGVGARNLKECLAIQLQALPGDTPYRDLALLLVNKHLESLASRDFGQIKKLMGCNDECLRAIQSLIINLNPKPGAIFNATDTRYIVADVIVTKVNGIWEAQLNPEAMPRLGINRLYADMLSRNQEDSARRLTGQLNEARWLIKNMHQRSDTILKVSSAIVERQRQFFEHGEVAMRPLVLREIADTLGLHESTISRVTTQKFMHTPRGIFELKYFFGSHVVTDTGGACSATAIRALIKQFVKTENLKKPLSDNKISEILGKQGIVIARRTVAKYRESMQIPPANQRKSFN